MSRVEILYRDSSNQDGVLSRGAGWHGREIAAEATRRGPRERMRGLATQLTRGDLVGLRYHLRGRPRRLEMIHDGNALHELPQPYVQGSPGCRDQAAVDALKTAQEEALGWEGFWSKAEATWMLGIAASAKVERRLLVLAGRACAETVLRVVDSWDPGPRRALRLVGLWACGLANEEDLVRARQVVDQAERLLTRSNDYDEWLRSRAWNAASRAAESVVHPEVAAETAALAAKLGGASNYRVVTRSLGFLVGARLPSWVVWLALAGRP